MPPLEGLESLAAFACCVLIGAVSAGLGLGGGMFLVPLLTLVFAVPMREAVAVSLVCVLATSAAGSVALDRTRLVDWPIVAHLEVAAALGAVGGAQLGARVLPASVVAGIFAATAGYSAWRMLGAARGSSEERPPGLDDAPAAWPERYPAGLLGCAAAGTLGAIIGAGGAPIKVPVQTEVMAIPLRTALANSNLMGGMTAGVGAAVYLGQGVIPVELTAPCALGIALGAYAGGRVAPRVAAERLARAFALVLVLVTLRMLWKAIELAG